MTGQRKQSAIIPAFLNTAQLNFESSEVLVTKDCLALNIIEMEIIVINYCTFA